MHKEDGWRRSTFSGAFDYAFHVRYRRSWSAKLSNWLQCQMSA